LPAKPPVVIFFKAQRTTLEITKAILLSIGNSHLDYQQRCAALTAALAIHDADSCDVTVLGKDGAKKLEFKEMLYIAGSQRLYSL